MKEAGMNRYSPLASLQAQSPPYTNVQGRDFSTPKPSATGSSQALTRSLIDKIQEAKRLRHAEVVHGKQHSIGTKSSAACMASGMCIAGPVVPTDVQTKYSSPVSHDQFSPSTACQSTSASPVPMKVSTISPPVPHAKPVKPVIPLSPSRSTSAKIIAEGHQDKHSVKEHETKKMSSSVNTIIEITNAVLLIQRMWRGSRRIHGEGRQCKDHGQQPSSPENAEVTVVVDRDFGVKPLFAAVKMKRKMAQTDEQGTNEADISGGCDATQDESEGVIYCRQYQEERGSSTRSDPWTDHELVFLEEGRCIGELQESVRKGVPMDEDELVWKRPQQIIERLEAARASTLQKTRRKRLTNNQFQYRAHPNVNTVQLFAAERRSPRDVLPRSRGKHAAITMRKRKTFGLSSLKRRVHSKIVVVCRASKSHDEVLLRLQRVNDSRPGHSNEASIAAATRDGMNPEAPTSDLQGGENQPDKSESATQQAGSASSVMEELEAQADHNLLRRQEEEGPSTSLELGQFVVFSGFDEAASGADAASSRNDLISVGDLALARSLLFNRDHSQPASRFGEYFVDFIPLTLATSSPRSVQPNKQSMEPWNEPPTEPTQVATGCRDYYGNDNQAAHHVSDAGDNDVKNCGQPIEVQPLDRFGDEPEVLGPHSSPWTLNDLRARKEGHHDNGASLASPASPSSSSTNSARTKVSEGRVEAGVRSRQCSQSDPADPMRALDAVKTAVTTTMARMHSAYRDVSASDELQLEVPSSVAAAAPVATAIRVDEAKRLEFLRALDDFKRCLRPGSSLRSSASGA